MGPAAGTSGGGGGMPAGLTKPVAAFPPAPSAAAVPPAPRIDPNNVPRPRYGVPSKPARYGTADASFNVPPHAWSDHIVTDQGNATPRAMRATMGYVPITKDVLKETRLPLAVAVTPLATPRTWLGESPIQCVDFGAEGPPRCSRCRGYISPHCPWRDGGRTWSCPLCGESNEAPGWYVAPLDQYGARLDKAQRPELSCGSVEFVAPLSYLKEDDAGRKRQPRPLSVAFLVDVSLPAVTSGLLAASVYAVSSALDALEGNGDGLVRAGVVAFDGVLHYYDVSSGISSSAAAGSGGGGGGGGAGGSGSVPGGLGAKKGGATEYLALDIDDAFCPLALDQWCPPLANGGKQRLNALLERLPSMFPATIARSVQAAAGSAIKSAVDGLSDTGGRVVVFLSQPAQVGEGRLPPAEAPRAYGTDKEREMLVPTRAAPGAWYADVTRHAAGHGVSVDLLVCTPHSVDAGTVGQLAFTTGGELRRYPGFVAPLGVVPPANGTPMACASPPQEMVEKLAGDLAASLGREIGCEAVLKVRASKGLTVSRYMGNFCERAESEADLAGVDSDKTLIVTLAHDGNEMREGEGLFLQAALLYTTSSGSRRVRVHTLRLTAAESIHDIFRHADIDAIMGFLIRKSVQTVLTKEVRFVGPDLTESAIEMLYSYRRHCAAHSSAGQLILPESLKLLPLYLSVVTKLPAFAVNRAQPKAVQGRNPFSEVGVRADARLAELIYLSAQPLSSVVPYMYTRMYRVDNLAPAHGIALEEDEDPENLVSRPAHHASLTADQLRRVLLPSTIYPSVEQLLVHGIFLVEHSSGVYVNVGPEADERAVADLFGAAAIAAVNGRPGALPPNILLPVLDNDLSRQVWTIIAAIRSRRQAYLPLAVVVDGDAAGKEALAGLMVEDKAPASHGGARSYVDLLCHVHTSIQSRMAQASSS